MNHAETNDEYPSNLPKNLRDEYSQFVAWLSKNRVKDSAGQEQENVQVPMSDESKELRDPDQSDPDSIRESSKTDASGKSKTNDLLSTSHIESPLEENAASHDNDEGRDDNVDHALAERDQRKEYIDDSAQMEALPASDEHKSSGDAPVKNDQVGGDANDEAADVLPKIAAKGYHDDKSIAIAREAPAPIVDGSATAVVNSDEAAAHENDQETVASSKTEEDRDKVSSEENVLIDESKGSKEVEGSAISDEEQPIAAENTATNEQAAETKKHPSDKPAKDNEASEGDERFAAGVEETDLKVTFIKPPTDKKISPISGRVVKRIQSFSKNRFRSSRPSGGLAYALAPKLRISNNATSEGSSKKPSPIQTPKYVLLNERRKNLIRKLYRPPQTSTTPTPAGSGRFTGQPPRRRWRPKKPRKPTFALDTRSTTSTTTAAPQPASNETPNTKTVPVQKFGPVLTILRSTTEASIITTAAQDASKEIDVRVSNSDEEVRVSAEVQNKYGEAKESDELHKTDDNQNAQHNEGDSKSLPKKFRPFPAINKPPFGLLSIKTRDHDSPTKMKSIIKLEEDINEVIKATVTEIGPYEGNEVGVATTSEAVVSSIPAVSSSAVSHTVKTPTETTTSAGSTTTTPAASSTSTPPSPPSIEISNANFFDRYYKAGWESTDVKFEARGAAEVATDIPDFLKFAVPMKRPVAVLERKMDDVVYDGYTRARFT